MDFGPVRLSRGILGSRGTGSTNFRDFSLIPDPFRSIFDVFGTFLDPPLTCFCSQKTPPASPAPNVDRNPALPRPCPGPARAWPGPARAGPGPARGLPGGPGAWPGPVWWPHRPLCGGPTGPCVATTQSLCGIHTEPMCGHGPGPGPGTGGSKSLWPLLATHTHTRKIAIPRCGG